MSPAAWVYQNGRQVTPEVFFKKIEGSTDPNEFFHFGLFETLRTYGGKIFQEGIHLERLAQSAKTAGYPFPVNPEKIGRYTHISLADFVRKNPETRKNSTFIRISLWGQQVFLILAPRRLASEIFETGVRLQTSPVVRTLSNAETPEVKTSAYVNSLMAWLEPISAQIHERLLLDRNGCVTETTVGNIFIVKKNILYTPDTFGILNGVTRRFVIKCAQQSGLRVIEAPLTRHDAFNADEAFLTNTTWEILPVAELDGRRIGVRVPGTVTQKLKRTFDKFIEGSKI
jgi:branched-chain amino acid aminotransferase